MAAREELDRFVRDALGRGIARADVEGALTAAGWERREVKGALAAFADIDFPMPVPRPKPYLSARDAFVYLVLFSTLYISAYNFGRLLFLLIERAFPDPAAPGWIVQGAREAIRWRVSSLVVAFPIFFYVARRAEQAVRADPGKRTSKVRRWLTYLTLFIAAGVLIGDSIALVNGVLGGELTIRFVLKVSTVMLIAGAIFGYYRRDLQRDDEEGER
jgi:hypothetical protein